MPELAEVEFYKRQWEPALGQGVREVMIHHENRVFRDTDTRDLADQLPGREFRGARAHGKQMLFTFENDGWLGVHLGMAGKLFRHKPEAFVRHKHDHLVIVLESDVLVFRDTRYFGKILWHRRNGEPDWWTQSGPDLLSEEFTAALLEKFLRQRKRSPIKNVLLDQRFFAGIGNWMADEILWRAEIHPMKLAGSLTSDERARLFTHTREVCADAMRVIAPDWSNPPSSWLFPHRWKDGGTCPRTGTPLHRIQVGGRTTCYSPERQRMS
tara:strand:- start:4631 stop:5434 length:804 start_codon:yes stop_codon:yes gene_type:complete